MNYEPTEKELQKWGEKIGAKRYVAVRKIYCVQRFVACKSCVQIQTVIFNFSLPNPRKKRTFNFNL